MLEARDDERGKGGPFVLNLCTVPGGLSIPQPRSPDLVKYAFFVSRAAAGDDDSFWLHMGYFASREEADKWRERLHRIYPLAFVTPAPATFAPLK
jgi:hypothetical protein